MLQEPRVLGDLGAKDAQGWGWGLAEVCCFRRQSGCSWAVKGLGLGFWLSPCPNAPMTLLVFPLSFPLPEYFSVMPCVSLSTPSPVSGSFTLSVPFLLSDSAGLGAAGFLPRPDPSVSVCLGNFDPPNTSAPIERAP